MRKRTYIPLDESVWGSAESMGIVGESVVRDVQDIPVPVCHNIVSTSQIECTTGCINLQRIALLIPNSRYDRKRFAAITIRIQDPTCTGLLFSSGKLVITGSVSMYACILAAHTIAQLLRDNDSSQDFFIVSCVVQNIVAHAEIGEGRRIDVDMFYNAYCEYATYQKSVFPGLVFRPPDSPIVLLIFGSGKIVCTGGFGTGKSCNDIENGFRRLFPLIQPYIRRECVALDMDASAKVEHASSAKIPLSGHEFLGLDECDSSALANVSGIVSMVPPESKEAGAVGKKRKRKV